MSRLVDAAAAAELLGVPTSWVREATRRDEIPYVALGRYRRYDPDALDEWWRGLARGPQAGVRSAATKARRVATPSKSAASPPDERGL